MEHRRRPSGVAQVGLGELGQQVRQKEVRGLQVGQVGPQEERGELGELADYCY